MPAGDEDWTPADGRALKAARLAARETQDQCAAQLRRLGGLQISQGAVSEWERGSSKPRSAVVVVIREYCRRQGVGIPSSTADTVGNRESGTAFDGLVREIAGEPLLGPKQLALVEALTTRLRRGPPLSDKDDAAREWLTRVLRVD